MAGNRIGKEKEKAAVSGSESRELYELAYNKGYFKSGMQDSVLAKGPNSEAMDERNRQHAYFEGYAEGYDKSLNASIDSGISLADIVDSVLNLHGGLTLENAKKMFVYSASGQVAIKKIIKEATVPIDGTMLEFVTLDVVLEDFARVAANDIGGFLALNQNFCNKLVKRITTVSLDSILVGGFTYYENAFLEASAKGETEVEKTFLKAAVQGAKDYPKALHLVNHKLVRAQLIAEMDVASLTTDGLTQTHLDLLAEQTLKNSWSDPLEPETVLVDAVNSLLADPNKIGYLKSEIICAALIAIMLQKRVQLLGEAEKNILALAGEESVLVQQAKNFTLVGANDPVVADRPYGLANDPTIAMVLAKEMVAKVGGNVDELSPEEMILVNEDRTHTILVTELLKQAVQVVVSDANNPKKQLSVFEIERIQENFVAAIIRQAQTVNGISVDYATVVQNEISLAKAVLRHILAFPAREETKALLRHQTILKMVCEMIVFAARQGPLANACFVPMFRLAVGAGEIEALLATKPLELLAALVEIAKKEHLTELSNNPIVQEALLEDIQKTISTSAMSNLGTEQSPLLEAHPSLVAAAGRKVLSNPVDPVSHVFMRQSSVKKWMVEDIIQKRDTVDAGVEAVLATYQEVGGEIAKEIYTNHRTESNYIESPLATCHTISTLISQERVEQLKSLQNYLQGSQHQIVEEAGKRFLTFKSAKVELPPVPTSMDIKNAQSALMMQLARRK